MKNYIKFLSVPLACTAIQPIMAENSQPNIILILTDDLGYGDLSTYNPGSKIQTTNLDRMASEGVCFTDAHSSSAVPPELEEKNVVINADYVNEKLGGIVKNRDLSQFIL